MGEGLLLGQEIEIGGGDVSHGGRPWVVDEAMDVGTNR
jgi:hypothetical protein